MKNILKKLTLSLFVTSLLFAVGYVSLKCLKRHEPLAGDLLYYSDDEWVVLKSGTSGDRLFKTSNGWEWLSAEEIGSYK